ncbi:hypothetical protein CC2G_012686 [Coprinopsis cinerea AmutBmut pab1-1]|nr:hypothetical protein CC2G_012686 [Coprinopsis cinerea AmutBmut pab1-1]
MGSTFFFVLVVHFPLLILSFVHNAIALPVWYTLHVVKADDGFGKGSNLGSKVVIAVARALIIVALCVGLLYVVFPYMNRLGRRGHSVPRLTVRVPPPPMRGRPVSGGVILSDEGLERYLQSVSQAPLTRSRGGPHYLRTSAIARPAPTYSPPGTATSTTTTLVPH